MSELHWAVFALRDIHNALDRDRYKVAGQHIDDAIAAICARDEQDSDALRKVMDSRTQTSSVS